MRLLAFLLLITTSTFAQDNNTLLLEYVNIYRAANGVGYLTADADLQAISDSNTANMVANDSLMHSGTDTYECATRQFTLAPTQEDLNSFNKFLGKYFDDSYEAPKGGTDDPAVIDYTLLYIVYSWHSSPAHRAVMLTKDATIGSCSVDLGRTDFKPNYKKIGGKIVFFNKFISHFQINAVATLNLNL